MQTRRKTLLVAGASVTGAVVLTILLSSTAEPRCRGHTLDQWIQIYMLTPDSPREREAADAIRLLATNPNSMRNLIRRIAFDTPWVRAYERLPRFIRQTKPVATFVFQRLKPAPCDYAMRAFDVAGTNAVCAIPALTELATTKREEVAMNAIYALSFIGPAALPSLRQAMSSPHSFVRHAAVGSMKTLGTNALVLLPNLTRALSDSDPNVRWSATNVLEDLAPEALTNSAPQ